MTEIDLAAQEPTLAQWRLLYETAQKVKEIKPWQQLWDTNLVTLQLPERAEPVFCATIGHQQSCFGIHVYPDRAAIARFFKMLEAREYPEYIKAHFQDCLSCFFGNEDELSQKDKELLVALDLDYEGESQIPYFRSISPGLFPWYLSAKEVDLLTRALKNYVLALHYVEDRDVTQYFEKGGTLFRGFSPEENMWYTLMAPIPPLPEQAGEIKVTDTKLLNKLKRRKRVNSNLELELFYLAQPLRETAQSRPFFPQMCLLADRDRNRLLTQHALNRGEVGVDVVLNVLTNYIMEVGRPNLLYIRDSWMATCIGDLCAAINVKLMDCSRFKVIDPCVEGELR